MPEGVPLGTVQVKVLPPGNPPAKVGSELKLARPVSEATVWGKTSLFFHSTELPAATDTLVGLNEWLPVIKTVAGRAGPELLESDPEPAQPAQAIAKARIRKGRFFILTA